MPDYVTKTAEFVRNKLEGEGSGHDWWHILRVWNMSKRLASEATDPVSTLVIELAALLHDIADHKFHNGDLSVGPKVASEWLHSIKVDKEVIDHVSNIIKDLSFKGAEVATPMKTMEGKIDRMNTESAKKIANERHSFMKEYVDRFLQEWEGNQ